MLLLTVSPTPVVTSSKISNLGLPTKAKAILARLLLPPLNVFNG